jgi:phosphatidylglycerol:prolipoprotein diacylglycerol transferase
MIFHHNFSPEIIGFGALSLRWYGLLYVTGLVTAYLLAERRLKNAGLLYAGQEGKVLNIILLAVIGGSRLGYCLFYNLPYYTAHPLEVLFIWQGGLSFHGGLIGVLIAMWVLGGKSIKGFYEWGDAFALFTPIGLGLGRLGNFMNSELVGRPTDGSWGVVYERVDSVLRHPSQLYEAFLEGLVLFLILYWISRQTKREGVLFWSFIGLYGLFRFLVEFVREPDFHLGLVWGPLTQGQLLSLPLIFGAFVMTGILLKKKH